MGIEFSPTAVPPFNMFSSLSCLYFIQQLFAETFVTRMKSDIKQCWWSVQIS